MLKMVIGFDEDKIKRNGHLTEEEMFDYVNRLMESCGLKVCGNGVYTDNGGEDDLFEFMVVAGVLPDMPWFSMCVKQWDWYEDADEPDDLMKTFKIAG